MKLKIDVVNSHFLDPASLAQIADLDKSAEKLRIPYGEDHVVWRRWGSGDPVVLLHGGGGCWLHWIRNIEFLARSYSVLVPDLPAFGDSSTPKAGNVQLLPGEVDDVVEQDWGRVLPLPMDFMARVLVNGLTDIVGDARVAVVGFSFGSVVASHVCARLGPARAALLVLAGSTAVTRETFGRSVILQSWRDITDREALRAVQRANLATLMLADENSIDDLAVDIQILGTSRVRMRRVLRKSLVISRLAGTGIRVAGIWGRQDATMSSTPDEIERALRQIHPEAELHIVEEAGHWVAYERSARFNAILSDLFAHAFGKRSA